jgi:hypothetical protein
MPSSPIQNARPIASSRISPTTALPGGDANVRKVVWTYINFVTTGPIGVMDRLGRLWNADFRLLIRRRGNKIRNPQSAIRNPQFIRASCRRCPEDLIGNSG